VRIGLASVASVASSLSPILIIEPNSHHCCVVPRGAPCDDTALAYDIAY